MKNVKNIKKQKDEVVGALNEARKLAKELARRDDEGGSGKDLLKRARTCSEELRRFSLKLAASQSSKKS